MATKATSVTASRSFRQMVEPTKESIKNCLLGISCHRCNIQGKSQLPDLRHSSTSLESASLKDFQEVKATDSPTCYETFKTGLRQADSENLKCKIIREYLASSSNWKTINPI